MNIVAAGTSIKAHLEIAKQALASSENDLRRGAEHIAQAVEKGATQRQAAESVGKSAAWVNRLLRWRAGGYQDDSPFGPEAKSKRERARVQAAEQKKQSVVADHLHETDCAERSCETKAVFEANEGQSFKVESVTHALYRHLSKHPEPGTARLTITERKNLVDSLILLGACTHPVVRSKLALAIEHRRASSGLTWDQLIIPENDAEPTAMPLEKREGA